MFRTPFGTVARGLWTRVRWVVVTIVAGIALAYTALWFIDLRGLRPNAGEASEDFMVALLLIGTSCLAGAAAVLLANSDAEHLHLALPARVFRLPLDTWKVTTALLALGAGVGALLAAASTVPALWLLNVDFAWWLPVLTAVTLTPLAQLWAYTFGSASPRPAVVSFVLYFGALSWLARRPFFADLATANPFWLNAALVLLFLGGVFLIMWFVIHVQRHGGWSGSLAPRARLERPRRPLRPFSSRWQAQLWFEWRQYGLLLPMCVGGVAVAYFLGLPLVVGVFRMSNVTGPATNEPLFRVDWYTSAQFVVTGLGLSTLLGSLIVGGVMFMRAGHWNSRSKYLLTRPLNVTRIANARVYALLASAILALAILIGLVALMETITALQGESTGLGTYLHQGYEQLPLSFVLAVFAGGLFLLMWTFSWSASYIYIMAVFGFVVFPPVAAVWGAALVGLSDAAQAQERTVAMLPYLNWLAAIVVMAGLLAMAWRADTKRLIQRTVPVVAAVAWFGYSAAFVHYAKNWDVPVGSPEWAVQFPHPINWPVWIGVSVLPLVPLFLHPLLIERTRHR